ncbi:hypothetical protein FACS189487_06710 [Campylobacterota bacterium]|nr:hypothetical protein FACS189487_06710 [Campylobacterota bacterium]
MITASEIKKRSANIYIEYLKAVVSGELFFPKVIRSNKSVSPDFNEMRKELAEIIEYSKDRKGFGYTIIYKQTNTRKHGIQSLPDEINFQTEIDFLKYLHKEKEVEFFRNNTQQILLLYPQLQDWIAKYPQKIVDNQDKWEDILKVCTYFKTHPVPNLYIRELPIQVPTKFIETNKTIISDLLDIIIADSVNLTYQKSEKDFEKRYNLKYAEPLVRFRILDHRISQSYFLGVDDLSIPITQFEQLNLSIKKIFVVENKMNVLTLPTIDEAIVLFGSGYGVEVLKNVRWFDNIELFYWGDLDADGFQILSQFRSYFPHVKSFLMDQETFDRYFENGKGTPSKISAALNLTDDEKILYEYIKCHNYQLEQEKIPIEYVKYAIDNIPSCYNS